MKKNILISMACLFALTLFITSNAFASLVFQINNEANSFITFTGTDPGAGLTGSFSFTHPTDSPDFHVTSSLPTGSATGFLGTISGTFDIGTITIAGTTQTAPVSGAGIFTINDGGTPFTATVVWNNISIANGAFGGLNSVLSANLTGFSYAGTNSDLVQLFNLGLGIGAISFQFAQAQQLTDLTLDTNVNGISTSYSGTLVPIPGTVLLLGSGLIGLVSLGWRKKRKS